MSWPRHSVSQQVCRASQGLSLCLLHFVLSWGCCGDCHLKSLRIFGRKAQKVLNIMQYSIRACVHEALPTICCSFIHLAFTCRQNRNSALIGSIRPLEQSIVCWWLTIVFWLKFRVDDCSLGFCFWVHNSVCLLLWTPWTRAGLKGLLSLPSGVWSSL